MLITSTSDLRVYIYKLIKGFKFNNKEKDRIRFKFN
jgi:hypothetical protein